MLNEESTSVRVPIFNSEEKNSQGWWIEFQAYARVRGFHSKLKDAGIMITKAEMEILEVNRH